MSERQTLAGAGEELNQACREFGRVVWAEAEPWLLRLVVAISRLMRWVGRKC